MYSQPFAPQPSTTRRARREQLAGGCAIQAGIADDRIPERRTPVARTRGHNDGRAGQALADIVVRIAQHFQKQALNAEHAERLTRRTFEPDVQPAFRQRLHAELAGDA